MLVKDFAIENNAATSNTFEASSSKDNSMESSTTTATDTTSFTTTTTSSTTTSSSASAAATTAMININDDDDDSYVVGEEEEDELFVSNELEGDEDELSVSDENEDDDYQDEILQEEDGHENKLMNSIRKIRALQGMTTDVVKGTGRSKQTITWKVIPYHDAPDPIKARSKAALGIRSQKVLDDLFDSDLPLADLFLYLTFRGGKWQRWLRVLNMKVKELNKSRELKRNIGKFSPQEFLISHALLICAFHCSGRGCMLWEDPKDNSKYDKAW